MATEKPTRGDLASALVAHAVARASGWYAPMLAGALCCTPLASETDSFADQQSPGGAGAPSGGGGSSSGARPGDLLPSPGVSTEVPAGGAGGSSSPLDPPGSAGVGGGDGEGVTPSPPDAGPEVPPVRVCMSTALRLDGASYAVFTNPVQDDFTLEAWIATTASRDGTQAFYGLAVIDGDVVGTASDFAISVLNERFAFAVGAPDTTLQGSSAVIDGEWVHVAATRRSSTGEMTLLVNGVVESRGSSTNRGPVTDPMTLAIGGALLVRNFVGLIDEVRIWNIVRSPEEIQSSMHQIMSADELGLVGYYRFEDSGSVTAADSSSQGSDATLVGAPTYELSTALCPSATIPE